MVAVAEGKEEEEEEKKTNFRFVFPPFRPSCDKEKQISKYLLFKAKIPHKRPSLYVNFISFCRFFSFISARNKQTNEVVG